VKAELGTRPSDVVCGVVGRLVWEKGYREVFEAASALSGRAPAIRFVVVGPVETARAGAVSKVDIDRAANIGVRFLGLRRDMEALYAAMDLYVLASYREGFPRSAMEAAAMGLPAVATAIRGCRQVVQEGATGLLVPPRDAVALTRAVATLAGDPALRLRMGEAARAKAVAEFDQQQVIERTLATYERLLKGRGKTVDS